jgi:hypothetical protein
MSLRTITATAAIVLVVSGGIFVRQRTAIGALRDGNAALVERLAARQRDHIQGLPVAAAAAATEDEHAALLRLREKATQLRARLAVEAPALPGIGSRKREGGFTDDDLVADVPKQAWTFSGYNTPKDALMSILSAQVLGDFNAVSNSFSPFGRSSLLGKKWDGKSETDISTELVAQMQRIAGIHVVDANGGFGGTRCDIHVELIWDDGSRTTSVVVMERDSATAPEWKCSSEGALLSARPR